MKTRWLTFLSWSLAAVLIWAGGTKVLNPAALAENIMGFRIVPWPMAVAGAFYLPWLELVVGLGLLVPHWRTGAAWISALLFTGFALLWLMAWARGINVACGCFGNGGESHAALGFTRALVLTVLAWACVKGGKKP